jgi:hypothetical protein
MWKKAFVEFVAEGKYGFYYQIGPQIFKYLDRRSFYLGTYLKGSRGSSIFCVFAGVATYKQGLVDGGGVSGGGA